jgi:hypothetical protein
MLYVTCHMTTVHARKAEKEGIVARGRGVVHVHTVITSLGPVARHVIRHLMVTRK